MPAFSRTISRRRRRARLRATALPTFFDTVKPKRGGAVSARSRACNTNAAAGILVPVAAARKSARRFSRSMGAPRARASGTEALASPRAPRCDDLAAADGGGPGAEAVTALAHQFAQLIGPFHGSHIQLVAAWALKVAEERRRFLENALKPACPRLPALEAWRAYTGGLRPKSMRRENERRRGIPGRSLPKFQSAPRFRQPHGRARRLRTALT